MSLVMLDRPLISIRNTQNSGPENGTTWPYTFYTDNFIGEEEAWPGLAWPHSVYNSLLKFPGKGFYSFTIRRVANRFKIGPKSRLTITPILSPHVACALENPAVKKLSCHSREIYRVLT